MIRGTSDIPPRRRDRVDGLIASTALSNMRYAYVHEKGGVAGYGHAQGHSRGRVHERRRDDGREDGRQNIKSLTIDEDESLVMSEITNDALMKYMQATGNADIGKISKADFVKLVVPIGWARGLFRRRLAGRDRG